jgi:RsiW-degrading membrane proteinase PrsW (M82 family)
MSATGNMWQTDRSRLIGLAGAGVALGAILLNLGFFFRPGTSEVLGGLAHHAFVLGCMLILTSGSRTVSLSTLGVFWLLGVWSVFGLTYVLQSQIVSIFGAEIDGEFMVVWLAPFTEEALKLAPVAIFLLLAGRSGYRHPSMSDGLLLGFMVGAGVAFQEDAHYGEILGSGDGWGAATPWTAVFPTVSPLGNYFALNHALWGALSGLSIGAALMLRHWRWAWPIALAGPVLSFTNHVMANQVTFSDFGTRALLNRASGSGVPWFYDTIRDLTDGGRLPMLVLIAGTVAVVVVDLMIQRWVAKRDRMFPSLPFGRLSQTFGRSTSWARIATLLAADRYMCLRRSLYFAGWRTSRAGGYPGVTDKDYAELISLAVRLGIFRSPGAAGQPSAAAPPVVPADIPTPAAATAVDAPASDAPPAG